MRLYNVAAWLIFLVTVAGHVWRGDDAAGAYGVAMACFWKLVDIGEQAEKRR